MGLQWHQLDHMQIICTTLQTDNHVSTPLLILLRARCSSWRPTNSVKALHKKQKIIHFILPLNNYQRHLWDSETIIYIYVKMYMFHLYILAS